jgi:hypothetical protein
MPTYTLIYLTDGTTTIELTDQSNYALTLSGWAPNVSYLRESTFGGQGPYNDVEEQITVDVFGPSAMDALANVDDINSLLMQARRWTRGESVSAVRIQCWPQGGVLSAPLDAVVTGLVGAPPVIHPSTWNDELMISEISDVQIHLSRRGAWIGLTDTIGLTNSPANNPNRTTITFPSHPYECPLRLDVQLTASGGTISTNFCTQYLLYTHSPGFISVLDANVYFGGNVASMGGSGSSTLVGDSPSFAYNTNIARVTVNTTWTIKFLHPTLPGPGAAIEVFAVVRNSSGTDFTARCCLFDSVYGRQFPYGPYRTIPSNGINIQIISLGVITSTTEAVYDQVWIECTQTTGSGKDIDINYITTMPVESVLSGCVAVKPGNADYAFTGTGTPSLVVDHQILTKPEPFVGISTNRSASLDYTGNAFLTTRGTSMQVVRMAVNGTQWRHVSSTGAIVQDRVVAKRARAYLTPQ